METYTHLPIWMPWTPLRNNAKTLTLDSAQRNSKPAHLPYSSDKKSQFYKEAKDVMDVVDKRYGTYGIASFPGCNPFIIHQQAMSYFAREDFSAAGIGSILHPPFQNN